MHRRTFLLAAMAALAAPRAVEAQKPDKIARLGILGVGAAPSAQELARSVATNPFWKAMRQLGWIDGQNLVVERRFGETAEQLRAGAADLVRRKVDVLFVSSVGLAKMLQAETKTIPIVIGRADSDLVAAGLVESLARPGGNVTGAQLLNDELIPKRLELLKSLVPRLTKVALLREDVTTSPFPTITEAYAHRVGLVARSLELDVHTLAVRGAADFAPAFGDMKKNQDQALMVTSPAFMFVHRKTVVELATAHRLPSMFETEPFVESGGLMSYGVNAAEMQLRAAGYVDRILRGARPGDLPVEQPTKLELIINMKTARALGLAVPPSLLLRVDQVIE